MSSGKANVSNTSLNDTKSTNNSRRRKLILEKLKSDLSPKYIGMESTKENQNANVRNLRKNRNNGLNITFPPTTEVVVVEDSPNLRRISDTNLNFLSPIDKLLLKNGSKVPLDDQEIAKADVSWFELHKENTSAATAATMPLAEKSDDSVVFVNETTSKMPTTTGTSTNGVHSPSTVSLDSAKGSSVVNSEICVLALPFVTGDICWGQIYNYCYWPCIVCPDPEGVSISTIGARNREQHIAGHVRFFGDNGRRNWVKRDNLMPFEGIKAYNEHVQQMRQNYGDKNNRVKLLLPQRNKLEHWRQAVVEAEQVMIAPLEERLNAFEEIQKTNKKFSITKRRERLSSTKTVMPDSIKMEKNGDDADEIINKVLKRARSVSPFSPAYSPIIHAAKRIKSNAENTMGGLMTTKAEATLESFSEKDDKEFKKFYVALHNYIFESNTDDDLETKLLFAVRNIWSIKQINHMKQQQRLLDNTDGGSEFLGSSLINTAVRNNQFSAVRRLSQRLKFLNTSRTLSTSTPTPKIENEEKKSIYNTALLENSTNMEQKKTPKKPINRPIEDVVDDILHLDSRFLFKGMTREPICKYCYKPGGNLNHCEGYCQMYMHTECNLEYLAKEEKRVRGRPSVNNSMSLHKTADDDCVVVEEAAVYMGISVCRECKNIKQAKCCVCNNEGLLANIAPNCCNMPQCTRYMHEACCQYWPQAKFIKSKSCVEHFRCPSHVCHSCVSDDPKGKFQHLNNAKLTRCIKCPAAYHTDSKCIPAGSKILSNAYIICPRHCVSKSDQQVNVNWCFICVSGGQVVCCETCPIAVHAACLKIPLSPEEGYICEECESGRLPLYGELVWAKFNTFRWWPAIILPPTEVPSNIQRLPHNEHDFVLRFFGTHDHGWISRRRVYLFVEGDSEEPPRTKATALDKNYVRGVEEAKRIYALMSERKRALRLETGVHSHDKLQPQPYVKIKTNRAVPPFKLRPLDIEQMSKCECHPDDEQACGPYSSCLNRLLYHECNPKVCAAGVRCNNQMFESRISPRLDVVYMKERGFGLVCREPIAAGTFIIEYVGELINDTEFAERLAQKVHDRDENFYFLSLEKDHIIDAGPKGNLARFMNHSCDPNCETQKWVVNCNNRVGIFAIKDIPANSELTFNYLWDDLLSKEKKTCFCGAATCAGQIGGKPKEEKPKNIAVSDANKSTQPVKRNYTKKLKIRIKKHSTVKKMKKVKNHKDENDNAVKLPVE